MSPGTPRQRPSRPSGPPGAPREDGEDGAVTERGSLSADVNVNKEHRGPFPFTAPPFSPPFLEKRGPLCVDVGLAFRPNQGAAWAAWAARTPFWGFLKDLRGDSERGPVSGPGWNWGHVRHELGAARLGRGRLWSWGRGWGGPDPEATGVAQPWTTSGAPRANSQERAEEGSVEAATAAGESMSRALGVGG